MINQGDSIATVKTKIADALALVGVAAPTSWSDSHNKINSAATSLGLTGITDRMAGGTARARINAVIAGLETPANVTLPTVTGDAVQGETLTTTTGTWTGLAPITYAYQWFNSDADITGATASTYVLTEDDIGLTVGVRVTATNVRGPVGVESDVTAPVTGGGALSVLKRAQQRRVSLLVIGDSEVRFGGHGIANAIAQKTFEAGILPFRTPLYLASNNNNSDGYLSSTSQAAIMGATTGAPAGFDPFRSQPIDVSAEYAWYTGTNVSSASNGVILSAGNPLDTSKALRAHFKVGTFDTGGGSFRPSWRRTDSPFTGLAQVASPGISVQTGQLGTARHTFDVPADPARTFGVHMQWSRPSAGTDTMVENFFGQWSCAENPERTAGLSVDVLYGQGGQSLYDMAAAAIARGTTMLGNYLADIRSFHEAVGQTPEIVIAIKSDLNDTNETSSPSLGPNPSNSPTSAAAWTDNLTALINRIEAIYDARGWDKAGLHFLIIGSHNFRDSNSPLLPQYNDAGAAFAASRPRVQFTKAVVDAWPSSRIIAENLFQDNSHLTSPAGYNDVYGETLTAAIMAA